MRFLKKNPLLKLLNSYVIDSPQPSNISYSWNFGSLLAFCLIIQIITGVTLAMHYNPSVTEAFNSVEHIMRDVNNGWLIRYLHSNTASAFFFLVYLHIARGLYYGSYKTPRTLVWTIGTIIFILMMATAFLGYVLPFGQMSLWGATVITNLMSAIPWIGQDIVEFIWGGFSVSNATLNRFFSLHFVLPFVLAALALMHLIVLHDNAGSGNPLGISGNADRLAFAPYFIFKDLITIFIFILFLSILVFFMPNTLGDSENYVMANAMQTPSAIVPEWYLLPFYAILRSIPIKLLGVIAMFSAILILLVMPFVDLSRLRGIQFRPLSKIAFFFFISNFLILMVLGAKHVESPYIEFGQISTALYFSHFLIIVPLITILENTLTELSTGKTFSLDNSLNNYNIYELFTLPTIHSNLINNIKYFFKTWFYRTVGYLYIYRYSISVLTLFILYIEYIIKNRNSNNDAAKPWGLYFQDSATPQMEGLVELHDNILFYLVIILFGVGWVLISIVSIHDNTGTYISHKNITHGTFVELVWTVLPGLILILIAFPSFKLLYLMDEVSDPSMVVFIEGHQWYWSYQYADFMNQDDEFLEFDSYLVPESDLEEGTLRMLEVDNRLILPEFTHIRFIVTAADVIHAFACPSLGIKCDAYPGRLNQTSILINREGVFYGQCSEICGILHSSMPIVVESVSVDKFVSWLTASSVIINIKTNSVFRYKVAEVVKKNIKKISNFFYKCIKAYDMLSDIVPPYPGVRIQKSCWGLDLFAIFAPTSDLVLKENVDAANLIGENLVNCLKDHRHAHTNAWNEFKGQKSLFIEFLWKNNLPYDNKLDHVHHYQLLLSQSKGAEYKQILKNFFQAYENLETIEKSARHIESTVGHKLSGTRYFITKYPEQPGILTYNMYTMDGVKASLWPSVRQAFDALRSNENSGDQLATCLFINIIYSRNKLKKKIKNNRMPYIII